MARPLTYEGSHKRAEKDPPWGMELLVTDRERHDLGVHPQTSEGFLCEKCSWLTSLPVLLGTVSSFFSPRSCLSYSCEFCLPLFPCCNRCTLLSWFIHVSTTPNLQSALEVLTVYGCAAALYARIINLNDVSSRKVILVSGVLSCMFSYSMSGVLLPNVRKEVYDWNVSTAHLGAENFWECLLQHLGGAVSW